MFNKNWFRAADSLTPMWITVDLFLKGKLRFYNLA